MSGLWPVSSSENENDYDYDNDNDNDNQSASQISAAEFRGRPPPAVYLHPPSCLMGL